MRIREPVVAGQFYPGDPEQCREGLTQYLEEAVTPVAAGGPWITGLVPHAGWVFSGAVAARVFGALAAGSTPDVVVLFGGVHRSPTAEAAMFADGRWDTPLGPVTIDARLAERIMGQSNLIRDDPFAHENEHSIEVQMPFVKHLFPEAKVVPIMVPPNPKAHKVGESVARTLATYDYQALIVGTTDLTHYGPNYGFVPEGIGPKGNTWAKETNDPRFIELVLALRSTEVVAEAREHRNACAAGAVAATIAAATGLGATRGVLLEHTSSSEIMPGDASDSVGYAGIVFG